MDSAPPYAASTPGIFGTKIPTSVVFAVGILLFLLPFAEVKCKSGDRAKSDLINISSGNWGFTNTGLGLAIGSNWKSELTGMSSLFGDNNTRDQDRKRDNPDPNPFAIAALGLGIIGLIVALLDKKPLGFIAITAGVLGAASLVGLMFDLKKKIRDPVSAGLDKGNEWIDKMNDVSPVLEFTPWFYITIIAFLVAAFFSYKRMRTG